MNDRNESIDQEEIDRNVEIIKAATNAKCLNGHSLKIVLNKKEVPRTSDKINVRCQICEELLED